MGEVGRNDRVLLAEFDSPMQAQTWDDVDWLDGFMNAEHPLLQEALGKLRLEALLSQQIVVTDAQLLDGRLLLGLATSGLLEKMETDSGKPLPIEVRTRGASVAATLGSMYRPKSAAHGFEPSFFTEGPALASKMGPLAHGRENFSHRDVAPLLRDAGASMAETQALLDGWHKVHQLVKNDRLTLRTWADSRSWDEALGLSDRFLPIEQFVRAHLDDENDIAAVLKLGAEGVRSMFRGSIGEEASAWSNPATGELLRFWFDERYNRALAFQHNADYRSIHSGVAGKTLYREIERAKDPRYRHTTLDLPEGFLVQLGRLTTEEWKRGYTAATEHLGPWWENGNADELKQAMDDLIRLWHLSDQPMASRSSFSPAMTFGFTLGADLAALPLSADPVGVAGTLLITLGTFAVGALSSTKPGTGITATDYFDDV